MTITRKELAALLIKEAYSIARESAEFLDLVFEIMAETLERGEKIKIHGFGNFTVREKGARRERNPKTGEEIQITGRKVVTFKSSNFLRKNLKRMV